MTKDLASLVGPDQPWLDTEGFMDALDHALAERMASAATGAGDSKAD